MTLITTSAIALGGIAAYAFKRFRTKQKAADSAFPDVEPLDAWPYLATSQSAKRVNACAAAMGLVVALLAVAAALVSGGAIAWPL